MAKRLLKGAALLLAALVLIAGVYAGYVLVSYHRLPDTDVLAGADGADGTLPEIAAGTPHRIVSWNLGFGAYSADYSFFMDGGTESRAYSEAAVLANIGHAVDVINAQDADFKLLQEVDIDATRSYHVDEAGLIQNAVPGCVNFAQNYDSPYLFYPLARPHGASKSGLLTVSDCRMSRLRRVSLPVERGLRKLLDLDRCYSVSYIPATNGRQLCLYNFHLSAYTSDGSLATEQLRRMCADMLAEYEAGNYVVGGGDFNKDLPGNSGEIFGVSGADLAWTKPLETGVIPEGLRLVDALDRENPVPSCRNADSAYQPGKSVVLIVDGFIVSDNVCVNACRVIDEGFACSDHNPVVMEFELMEE